MKSESFWNHDDEKKKGAEEGAQWKKNRNVDVKGEWRNVKTGTMDEVYVWRGWKERKLKKRRKIEHNNFIYAFSIKTRVIIMLSFHLRIKSFSFIPFYCLENNRSYLVYFHSYIHLCLWKIIKTRSFFLFTWKYIFLAYISRGGYRFVCGWFTYNHVIHQSETRYFQIDGHRWNHCIFPQYAVYIAIDVIYVIN
jgi:hypothetical protein